MKLTGNENLNLVAENGADSVACDALVDPSVFAPDRLDFVDGFCGEFRLKLVIFHPAVFRLRITYEKIKSSVSKNYAKKKEKQRNK